MEMGGFYNVGMVGVNYVEFVSLLIGWLACWLVVCMQSGSGLRKNVFVTNGMALACLQGLAYLIHGDIDIVCILATRAWCSYR